MNGLDEKRLAGLAGEQFTASWLRRQKFEILESNYHSRFGEIDMIAQNREYIVFVEVKTRKEGTMLPAKESVAQKKQEKILKTAMMYLSLHPTPLQPRFDVMEVYYHSLAPFVVKEFHYLEAAFDAQGFDSCF